MYAVPDVDEVVAVAKELGIHLSPDEAVKYQKYLVEQLGQLDTFVQARLEEPKPPMVSTAREPGYRPSAEEDPLNAWMWKCRIERGGRRSACRQDRQLQGPRRRGRHTHELRLLRPRRLHPRLRRNCRHPGAEGGGHHHRQERHERPEWRLRHRRRHRRLRPSPQSPTTTIT